ncbi:MAG: T9SS type A sorting domain-containing protein, partial [Flammeovirgaceae bacterium]
NLTAVAVNQPDLLKVTNVALQDIQCMGGTGSMSVTATGGVVPYVYEYSINNGSTFVTFTNSTSLTANTYLVRVKDANGCTALVAQPVNVTSPPAALDFTFVKSDYNGFNISCFGGSNGFATISPTGGNGASYSGYQFALDGGAYQTQAKIEFINAGNHTLYVKDARGCVVSKTTNFTQSPIAISASVARIKNVTCFNETNGEIEIAVVGGAAPYQYQILAQPYVDSNVYTNLGVGTYLVNVKDKNNCPAQTTGNIISLNPAITIAESITDVSCFGGADGVVQVTVGGGVAPFTYQWKDQTSTTNKATQLKKGQYTVQVTDNAGCKLEASYTVNQPAAALAVSLTSLPACWAQENGTVMAQVTGGTKPYQHAINTKAFDVPASFQVGVGNHVVKVRDAKGCTTESNVVVTQKINEPKYNFLAATKQYALDTLVITDISLPKPDSIQWTFDPQAIIIKKDQWAPQIKFATEGKYWVEMKSHFAGCAYTLRKNLDLKPYDPTAKPSKAKGYRTIETVEVSPNPSNGEFDLAIKLNTKSKVTVIIFDMLGVIQFSSTWDTTTEIKTKIALPNVAAGIYMLRATSETDAKDVRLSLSK